MKKVLLTLATLFCFGYANADQVTLDVSNATDIKGTLVEEQVGDDGKVKAAKHYQPLGSLSIDGYSFTFADGGNKTAPAYYYPTSTNANGKISIRVYKQNTLTVTAPNGVTFSKVTSIPDNGTAETVLYTGPAANTFTFTSTATTRINTLTFTLGEGGGDNPDPTPAGNVTLLGGKDASGADGWTFDNTMLPEGVSYIWQWKAYNNAYYLNGSAFVNKVAHAAEAWAVSPVITLSSDAKAVNFEHAAKFQTSLKTLCGFAIREKGTTNWTTLTIPTWPEAGGWDFANSGDIDISAYAGKEVEFGFKYGSTDGQADTWEIRNFVVPGKVGGNTPEPETKTANNVKEFYGFGENVNIVANFPLTVTFVSGNNCYAVDPEGTPTLLFGKTSYSDLDVIPAGWTGTYSPYSGMPEIKPVGELPAATEKGSFTPATIDLSKVSADIVNSIVIIRDVKFDEPTPARNADNNKAANFKGMNLDESVEITFRTNFQIESVEAGIYNVKAAIATYNGNVQVYPIAYEKSTAVDEIGVEAGEAVYYDLNGRQVKGNLDKGIYVKVLNGKASKVVVK